MRYTDQHRLGRFGGRWGCFATNIINIIETEMGRMMTVKELQRAIGVWFVSESVLIANYKHHAKRGDAEPRGWSASANPEWHFLVADLKGALLDLREAFGVPALTKEYQIIEYSTNVGSHFVLRIDKHREINPDPKVKTRSVKSVREI